MTLQDIHKEFDEDFFELEEEYPNTIKDIKDFYDKKIIELIKECIPETKTKRSKAWQYVDYELGEHCHQLGFNSCHWELIKNLKARNINLD